MLLHLLHQLWALQIGSPARPVFNLCGGGELSPLLNASDHHRFKVGASGVNGCCIASGAAAQDDKAMVLNVTHGVDSCSLLSIVVLFTSVCWPIGDAWAEGLPIGAKTQLNCRACCLPIRSVLGRTMVL